MTIEDDKLEALKSIAKSLKSISSTLKAIKDKEPVKVELHLPVEVLTGISGIEIDSITVDCDEKAEDEAEGGEQ